MLSAKKLSTCDCFANGSSLMLDISTFMKKLEESYKSPKEKQYYFNESKEDNIYMHLEEIKYSIDKYSDECKLNVSDIKPMLLKATVSLEDDDITSTINYMFDIQRYLRTSYGMCK